MEQWIYTGYHTAVVCSGAVPGVGPGVDGDGPGEGPGEGGAGEEVRGAALLRGLRLLV